MNFVKWIETSAAARKWHIELDGQHTMCGIPTWMCKADDVYRISRPNGDILKLCRTCRSEQQKLQSAAS
jgi:hypothetical protein